MLPDFAWLTNKAILGTDSKAVLLPCRSLPITTTQTRLKLRLMLIPLDPNTSSADSEAEPSDSRSEEFHNATYDTIRNALASSRA
jgi:hypothetical protein